MRLWHDRKDDYRLSVAWENLLELLRDAGRYEEYIEQSSRLAKHLRGIGEKDAAYKVLRNQVEWCEEIEHVECWVSVLVILKESYVEDEEYSQAGRTLDKVGRLRLRLGLGREAISSYLEAGRCHMMHQMQKAAMDSFTRGYEMAQVEMSPSSIGWYCFREVTIDSLVPSNLDGEAKGWTTRAVDHFSVEYKKSISRLSEYTETLEKRLTRLKKEYESEESEDGRKNINESIQEIRISGGWTWLCLASLYRRGPEEGSAPLGHRESMLQALAKSETYFKEVDKRSMVSYVKDMRMEVK